MRTATLSPDVLNISKQNARKDLDAGEEDSSLEELADSIQKQGLLSPLTVRSIGGGRYEVVAGQRRLLAWKSIRSDPIPCLVRDDLDDAAAATVSLVENVHRADMSPLDKARALKALHNEYGTYERVAQECAWSSTTVSRYIRLLDLPETLQAKLSTSKGSTAIGAMSRLAKTFEGHEAVEVHDRIAGFKASIQEEILKRSNGDLAEVDRLATQAREGAFDTRRCGGTDGCGIVHDIIEGRMAYADFANVISEAAANSSNGTDPSSVSDAARLFWKALARS